MPFPFHKSRGAEENIQGRRWLFGVKTDGFLSRHYLTTMSTLYLAGCSHQQSVMQSSLRWSTVQSLSWLGRSSQSTMSSSRDSHKGWIFWWASSRAWPFTVSMMCRRFILALLASTSDSSWVILSATNFALHASSSNVNYDGLGYHCGKRLSSYVGISCGQERRLSMFKHSHQSCKMYLSKTDIFGLRKFSPCAERVAIHNRRELPHSSWMM